MRFFESRIPTAMNCSFHAPIESACVDMLVKPGKAGAEVPLAVRTEPRAA